VTLSTAQRDDPQANIALAADADDRARRMFKSVSQDMAKIFGSEAALETVINNEFLPISRFDARAKDRFTHKILTPVLLAAVVGTGMGILLASAALLKAAANQPSLAAPAVARLQVAVNPSDSAKAASSSQSRAVGSTALMATLDDGLAAAPQGVHAEAHVTDKAERALSPNTLALASQDVSPQKVGSTLDAVLEQKPEAKLQPSSAMMAQRPVAERTPPSLYLSPHYDSADYGGGEACSRTAVLAADARLRRAYDRAIAAGVSQSDLISYRDRWAAVRNHLADTPLELIMAYRGLEDRLNRVAANTRENIYRYSRRGYDWRSDEDRSEW